MNILSVIDRKSPLFEKDLALLSDEIKEKISTGRFLVIGGAGSIGKEVARELFKRNPRLLHVVDISENNLVELVRELRSTFGYSEGEFKTFALDCGGLEFRALMDLEGPYDYIFNLSALKHVRSEKDPYTLMRMVTVNITNTLETIKLAKDSGTKKYFCVSTDKAANPVNMMGASKRIMEMFLMRESLEQKLSMARFANVAFSDGSLLHGFNQRFAKSQPFSVPVDVLRYFITPQESGELCLLSGIFGENRDIFFPKLNEKLHLTSFTTIAQRYLEQLGFEAYRCESELEARGMASDLIKKKKWPCYFFKSETTGEKSFEEFYTDEEELEMGRFKSVGIVKNKPIFTDEQLDEFSHVIQKLRNEGRWNKSDLVNLFKSIIPNFQHKETGKNLDQRM